MPIFHKRFPILFLLLLLSSGLLHGQNQIISPYSRFGVGDLRENNNAWNFSMGYTGIAFRSPGHVNYQNPASYAAFDSSSFVFEGGMTLNSLQLTTNYQKISRNYGSLGYLSFGFPVTRWWKTSLSLFPVSDVGYNIALVEERDDVGMVMRWYTGEGGINRFNWGNGFRIGNNLSLGINASYLFGNMDRGSALVFPDSVTMLNSMVNYTITISDLYFDFGAQYRFHLNKDVNLIAGITFAPKTQVNAKAGTLARTFMLGSDDSRIIRDTIYQSEDTRGSIVFPLSLGGGVAFEKNDHWLIGLDAKWQQWKEFRAFGFSDSLVNSFQISAGGEIVPDINSYTNYLKRIRYRLGFQYNSTYLDLRGQHLDEFAFSVGFGLPFKYSRTGLNLGMQIGTRGTTEANLIKETFVKFVIGFTIYEKWFVKRKYF